MANFTISANISRINEGGYQNNPKDKGNYNSKGQLVGTNHGIAAPTYEAWIGRVPSAADMKAITFDVAREIYKAWYWTPLRLSEVTDQSLANQLFDISLSGIKNATLIIQRAINDVVTNDIAIDGKYGPITFSSIQKIIESGKAKQFNEALVNRRKRFFESDGNPEFLEGWIARAEKYLNYPNVVSSVLPFIFAAILLLGIKNS